VIKAEIQRLLWTPDGISDRRSHVNDAVGVEVGGVIEDVVVADLGADKGVVPHVVLEAAAKVHQEVVAAGEARAEVYATGAAVVTVVADALPADAAEKIDCHPFPYSRRVHGIEVQEDGAKRLTAGPAVISLGRLPGGVKAETNTPVENDIGADVWVQASLFRTEAGSAVARSRRQERAEAEHGIPLLGLGEAG